MGMFQRIARAATMGAVAVLLAAPVAVAEQGGRYWIPSTANPAQYSEPTATSPAPYPEPTASIPAPYSGSIKTKPARHERWLARNSTKRFATRQVRKRSPLAAMAAIPVSRAHRLILQVNTNDPAAMNFTLNNASNVAQHYKEIGEKVKIEVITFGPGLHMLRDDTSPVKARIRANGAEYTGGIVQGLRQHPRKNASSRGQGHTDCRSGAGGEVRRGARDGTAGGGLDLCKTVTEASRQA